MTEHNPIGRDPFERELYAGLAAERAPDSLQRRVAEIPLEHLRPLRAAGGPTRMFGALFARPAASWATSFAAAAASLALGVWLGMAGLTATDTTANEDALVALVFSDTPTTIGDVQ